MKFMFIVFDLDDTIADTTHRQYILDEGDKESSDTWNAFFDACDKDTPKIQIITVLSVFAFTPHRVEIWTGRSERVREKTIAWLERHVVGFKHCKLRMRAADDFRHDTEVKADWIGMHGKPQLVFDDRNTVVEWWREQGITCCQVKESNY